MKLKEFITGVGCVVGVSLMVFMVLFLTNEICCDKEESVDDYYNGEECVCIANRTDRHIEYAFEYCMRTRPEWGNNDIAYRDYNIKENIDLLPDKIACKYFVDKDVILRWNETICLREKCNRVRYITVVE